MREERVPGAWKIVSMDWALPYPSPSGEGRRSEAEPGWGSLQRQRTLQQRRRTATGLPHPDRFAVVPPQEGRDQVFIDWKKSALFLVPRSLSRRNSMASCGPIGLT